MNEPLFLAEMIWAVLLIVQFQRAPEGKLLVWAGLVLVCAIFTRYDAWVYAAVAWLFATWPMLRHRPPWRGPVAGAWVLFTALLIAAPSLWLAYNAKQFGDPLDFIRGPYSARAIEARTTPPGSSPRPGIHNLHDSAFYFLKAAELGAAPLPLGKLLCWLTAAGTLAALWAFRKQQIWPLLLLWLPLPLTYSVAYGSVPIFIPVWRPFSWYNTRYGMELLPAFALSARLPVSGAGIARAQGAPLCSAGEFTVGGCQQPGAVARPSISLSGGGSQRPHPRSLRNRAGQGSQQPPHSGFDSDARLQRCRRAAASRHSSVPDRERRRLPDLAARFGRSGPSVPLPSFALDGDAVAQALQRHPQGLQRINVVCSTGQPCAQINRSELAIR